MRLNPELTISLTALALMAGCASQDSPPTVSNMSPDGLSEALSASCPEDVKFIPPEKISVTATALDWSPSSEAIKKAFSELLPKSLYELTSSDARFGGLSGIERLDDETLVTTADDGSLLWFVLDPETQAPSDTAFIAGLRDENGDMLDGKLDADSEGLAWNGETLFVSLERNHRVLAYDIGGCGSAARGAPILSFPADGFGLGKAIHENRGIEALAVRNATDLVAGLETNSNGSPVGIFSSFDTTGFTLRLPSPELTTLVGMDIVPVENGPDRLYALFRSYDPIRGNRIAIGTVEFDENGPAGEMKQLALWGNEILVDNFEGITASAVSDSEDQLTIISDNNFSSRQQTLIGTFSYEH